MCEARVYLGRVWAIGLLSAFLVALLPSKLEAGSKIENVACGQFLEREFDEPHQNHDYKILMEPGETINLRAAPVGDTLSVRVFVFEPAGQEVSKSDYLREIRLSTGKLSGRGLHTIRVTNYPYSNSNDSRVGVYMLEISCIRNNGSREEPGAQGRGPAPGAGGEATPGQGVPGSIQGASVGSDPQKLGKYGREAQKVRDTAKTVEDTVGGVASAVGALKSLWNSMRPGKAPAGDVGQAAPSAPPAPVYKRPEEIVEKGRQPVYAQPVEASATPTARPAPAAVDRRMFPLLGLGTVLQGEVTPSSGAQGCRFQAQAGQRIDLEFERLEGNLDLVVMVFAPDQRLVFQNSILANPRISTTLQVPVAGEYAVQISAGSAGTSSARFSLRLTAISR